MCWQHKGLGTGALGLALLTASAQAASPLLAEMIRARDLVCEMRSGSTQVAAHARRLTLLIQNLDGDSARMVSSASAGARPVRVYAGETGVHLVEDVATSVRVTSVLACMAWKRSVSPAQCLRYEAVNRWHFDTSVHRNPDQSYLRLVENSWSGTCEPWRTD